MKNRDPKDIIALCGLAVLVAAFVMGIIDLGETLMWAVVVVFMWTLATL